MIGDSLGRQVWTSFKGHAHMIYGRENCNETKVEFWGQELSKECLGSRASSFQQARILCEDPDNIRQDSQIIMIPHGKPLHHGGCNQEKMHSMTSTFDRIEKYGELEKYGEKVSVILTPGAHFSFANPIYYYYRLLELREKIREFKRKHPKVQVLFKGISWFPGNFVDANAVISSWNSLVLERVQEVIFGDEEVAMFLPLFDKTSFIFDSFGNNHAGIHPGQGGGNGYVMREIMRLIVDKLRGKCDRCEF